MASCGGAALIAVPGSISGSVSIGGVLLQVPGNPGSTGQQSEGNWQAWLIDPVEPVDAIGLPTGAGGILPHGVAQAGDYLLEIEFLAAADFSGGTEAATPVKLALPLPIKDGVDTKVLVNIEVIPPNSVSSIHGDSPRDGYRVRLFYQISGPRSETRTLEIDWSARHMRHDTDGDGSLDDETPFTDMNRDGISDNHREQLGQTDLQSRSVNRQGEITMLNFPGHTLTVGGIRFFVDEFTVITQGDSRIHFHELSLHDVVQVSGIEGRNDRVYARRIAVISE
ncbi:hypothetical protein IIA79_04105 [bacterium]|nr:hypothetical protein [bacterium]